MTEYVDAVAECDRAALPWLDGFWREPSNTLSPTPKALRFGVGSRAKRYLDVMGGIRYLVIEDWDQWRFEAERIYL